MKTQNTAPLTERQQNLLITALEGGSNYWCDLPYQIEKQDSENTMDAIIRILNNGESLKVYDIEDETNLLGEISLENIDRGESAMQEKYPSHFGDSLLDGRWDADTADVWLQSVVMGELVFG